MFAGPMNDVSSASSTSAQIAAALWPRTSLSVDQLRSLQQQTYLSIPENNGSGRTETDPISPASVSSYSSTATTAKTSQSGSSSPKEFGEEMFSVRRKAVPMTPDEKDLLQSYSPLEALKYTVGTQRMSHDEPWKPLPGLPQSQLSDQAQLASQPSPSPTRLSVYKQQIIEEMDQRNVSLPGKPPSLPSFSNLRLGDFAWDEEQEQQKAAAGKS